MLRLRFAGLRQRAVVRPRESQPAAMAVTLSGGEVLSGGDAVPAQARPALLMSQPAPSADSHADTDAEPWTWQLLPEGLLYKGYLAGDRESRFASEFVHDKNLGPLWDIALGGHWA